MSPGLLLNDPAVLNGAKPKPVEDGFGTRAIHVGSEPNVETGAVIPPISLSTTYKQEAVGVHKVRGHSYSIHLAGFAWGACMNTVGLCLRLHARTLSPASNTSPNSRYGPPGPFILSRDLF